MHTYRDDSSPRKGKLRAAAVHLTVSTAVAGTLLWIFVQHWYPLPFFIADGGWQGIRLIIGVDLMLGPLMSLVIYDRGKTLRALMQDYAVIVLIQSVALGWGVWTVFQQRTVLVVFADGSFYTVPGEVAATMGGNTAAVLATSADTPVYALIDMSDDPREQQRLRQESLSSGRPLYSFGELLHRLEPSQVMGFSTHEYPLDQVLDSHPEFRKQLNRFLDDSGGIRSDFLFMRAVCRYKPILLAFRRDSGEPAGWLEVPTEALGKSNSDRPGGKGAV